MSEHQKKIEEDTVDFVIESRSCKKGIDLPDRSESYHGSPTKVHSASVASAPGKLKMRWLQASKCQDGSVVNDENQQVIAIVGSCIAV